MGLCGKLWEYELHLDHTSYDEQVKDTFFGEYRCKLDSKGRLRLPTQLIGQLGGGSALKLVLNRGFEKCLMMYPTAVWDGIVNELGKLNVYDNKQRQFLRFFYRGATEVTLDNQDRILVPKQLIDYCGLQKELVISPLHDRLEIWPAESFEKIYVEEPIDFSDLAQQVLGGNRVEE